jgi:hypothetical protein
MVEAAPSGRGRTRVSSVQTRTTLLLRSVESQAGESLERLVPVLYQELKHIARRQLGGEGPRGTDAGGGA